MKDSILYQKEVERRKNKNNQKSRAKQSPEITWVRGLYKTISSIEELPPYDTIWGVCCLGSLNLPVFINGADIDWNELEKAIKTAVRFLDNVISVTPYFHCEIEKRQKSERRIGLGTMGLAELLIRLGLRYGSKESLAFIDKLYGFIAKSAYLASVELAKEKGRFPAYTDEFLKSGFMTKMPKEVRDEISKHGIRNMTLLTQAPTGSTATMVGTSTGIEPFFSNF